ncbi:MAG: hypothetical protein U9Q07_05440 [Planctomycetota bacterium]|nr:hypothetical protein [Planctomycetota bacterium]
MSTSAKALELLSGKKQEPEKAAPPELPRLPSGEVISYGELEGVPQMKAIPPEIHVPGEEPQEPTEPPKPPKPPEPKKATSSKALELLGDMEAPGKRDKPWPRRAASYAHHKVLGAGAELGAFMMFPKIFPPYLVKQVGDITDTANEMSNDYWSEFRYDEEYGGWYGRGYPSMNEIADAFRGVVRAEKRPVGEWHRARLQAPPSAGLGVIEAPKREEYESLEYAPGTNDYILATIVNMAERGEKTGVAKAKPLLFLRTDESGNPVFRENGQPIYDKKYINVAEAARLIKEKEAQDSSYLKGTFGMIPGAIFGKYKFWSKEGYAKWWESFKAEPVWTLAELGIMLGLGAGGIKKLRATLAKNYARKLNVKTFRKDVTPESLRIPEVTGAGELAPAKMPEAGPLKPIAKQDFVMLGKPGLWEKWQKGETLTAEEIKTINTMEAWRKFSNGEAVSDTQAALLDELMARVRAENPEAIAMITSPTRGLLAEPAEITGIIAPDGTAILMNRPAGEYYILGPQEILELGKQVGNPKIQQSIANYFERQRLTTVRMREGFLERSAFAEDPVIQRELDATARALESEVKGFMLGEHGVSLRRPEKPPERPPAVPERPPAAPVAKPPPEVPTTPESVKPPKFEIKKSELNALKKTIEQSLYVEKKPMAGVSVELKVGKTGVDVYVKTPDALDVLFKAILDRSFVSEQKQVRNIFLNGKKYDMGEGQLF